MYVLEMSRPAEEQPVWSILYQLLLSVIIISNGEINSILKLLLQRKTHYSIRVHGPKNIWKKIWIVDSSGIDGHTDTYLVIAMNGKFQYGGFTSWDFNTTKFKAKVIHYMNATTSHLSSNYNQHWHVVCGPIILHNSNHSIESLLYDIRDGQLRHIINSKIEIKFKTEFLP